MTEKVRDLLGQQFGYLKAISKFNKNNISYYNCICTVCNSHRILSWRNLKAVKTNKCGCKYSGLKKRELVGVKFGTVEIIKKIGRIDKNTIWEGKCHNCNSIKNYLSGNLNKLRKSCGCLGNPSGNKAHDFNGFGEISIQHFRKIKETAEKKELDFNITIEEIWDLYLKQDRKCMLSGQEIHFGKSFRSRTKTTSLDRIDSSKGYITGNIQWVHKDVNFIKHKNSDEKLFEICKKIYDFQVNNIKDQIIEEKIINIPAPVLERYKKLALKRKIEWNLNLSEINELYIKQNYRCNLTGKFLYFTKTYTQNKTASLDRIDSKKSYNINNVQWIDKSLNNIKNIYHHDYFIECCIKIYLNLKEKYEK